jgi:hypothetical protein
MLVFKIDCMLSLVIDPGAPPEGAELEWLIPEYGHTNGEEKIVIKGTKMTCRKYSTIELCIYVCTTGSV